MHYQKMKDFYHYYPEEFQDLLKQNYKTDNYIGEGNPNSKILLIGKECAIDKESDKDGYNRFIDNAKIWQENAPIKQNWFEKRFAKEAYHPRYPYYGQLMLPDNKRDLENTNRGTSPTWVAIQKFINHQLQENQRVQLRKQLNFYDYCFLTELSCNCMPNSSGPNSETRESIKKRISPGGILTHPYFRQFPVIILYIYHYYDWYGDINIIQALGGRKKFNYKGIIVSELQYDDAKKKGLQIYKVKDGFKKGEFINVHISEDGSQIIIHTNHFLFRSKAWMDELADTVKPFLGDNYL